MAGQEGGVIVPSKLRKIFSEGNGLSSNSTGLSGNESPIDRMPSIWIEMTSAAGDAIATCANPEKVKWYWHELTCYGGYSREFKPGPGHGPLSVWIVIAHDAHPAEGSKVTWEISNITWECYADAFSAMQHLQKKLKWLNKVGRIVEFSGPVKSEPAAVKESTSSTPWPNELVQLVKDGKGLRPDLASIQDPSWGNKQQSRVSYVEFKPNTEGQHPYEMIDEIGRAHV